MTKKINELQNHETKEEFFERIRESFNTLHEFYVENFPLLVKEVSQELNISEEELINSINENNLISILQSNFANDQSTTELKVKAKQYLAEIQKLKGQL